jgi:hypothetical protein
MGCGVSSSYVDMATFQARSKGDSSVSVSDALRIREYVDVDLLFSALLKMSYIFELKESLMMELISRIILYSEVKKQYDTVDLWIFQTFPDVTLTTEEVEEVIKYVKLYEIQSNKATISQDQKVKDIAARCQMMCPMRCEKETWVKNIREQEMFLRMRDLDAISSRRNTFMLRSSSSRCSSSRFLLFRYSSSRSINSSKGSNVSGSAKFDCENYECSDPDLQWAERPQSQQLGMPTLIHHENAALQAAQHST